MIKVHFGINLEEDDVVKESSICSKESDLSLNLIKLNLNTLAKTSPTNVATASYSVKLPTQRPEDMENPLADCVEYAGSHRIGKVCNPF
jgi:hypothetical protein